jgi:hypothetical protein
MKAKIIRKRPKYGLNTEIKYAEGGTNNFLVKFKGNWKHSWIGQFESDGQSGLCEVLTYEHQPLGVVIAGGRGYLVDIETREIRRITGDEKHIVSAVKTHDRKYFVAGTNDNIYVIDKEGNIREIVPDFNVEGFYLTKSKDSLVSGMLESDINEFEREIPFRVDPGKLSLQVDY